MFPVAVGFRTFSWQTKHVRTPSAGLIQASPRSVSASVKNI
jgi:hypothetical protein